MKERTKEELLYSVKQMVADAQIHLEVAEQYFPELLEGKDENIRKGIIAMLKFSLEYGSAIAPGFNETREEALAWLEKQKNSWDKNKVIVWLKDNIVKYAKLENLHTYADDYGTVARHFRGFNTEKLIEDLTKAME